MTTLIIAEKPSVAREIAAWIERHKAFGGGKAQDNKTHFVIGSATVVPCLGHLLENFQPQDYDERYAKWQMAHLPIIPSPFKMRPTTRGADKARVIGALLPKAKEVIHAGDPDDEGQLIVDELLTYYDYKGPVNRLWLNAVDDNSITKAMSAIKPNANYKGFSESALARSKSDWILGINLSRACSIIGRARGSSGPLSVGRVQTPTLALIVRREEEIRNFKPKDYFVPWVSADSTPGFTAKWKPQEGDERIDDQNQLVDAKAAQTIVDAVRAAGSMTVQAFSADKKTEGCPMPFSLSSLQSHLSARFGISAKQALDTAQQLYEMKLTSYPRVDCEYLVEDQHADAPAILASLNGVSPEIDRAISGANPALKSRAWDTSKTTAHFGIIPLRRQGGALRLTDIQMKVYQEIVRRYCLQFWPSAQYLAISIEVEAAGERFAVSGRQYTLQGWRSAFSDLDEDDDDVVSLPKLSKGDTLGVVDVGLDKQRTKAPSRYTEGTLLTAMKSAHKFVTNEKLKKILRDNTGIGTPATQAQTIETLIEKKYIERAKKSLVPTSVGEKLINALPKSITTVDLTAYWQQKMDDMREGRVDSHEAFVAEQIAFVEKILPVIEPSFKDVVFGEIRPQIERKETEHKCLDCGGALQMINGKFGWYFACQNEACKTLFKCMEGKPERRTQATVTEHVCGACKKGKLALKSNDRGAFYQCQNEKCRTFFGQVNGKPEVHYACPKCKKGRMRRLENRKDQSFFWGCSEYKSGCKHSVPDKEGLPDFDAVKKK